MSSSHAHQQTVPAQVATPETAPTVPATAAGEDLLRDALAAERLRVTSSSGRFKLRFIDQAFRPFRVY